MIIYLLLLFFSQSVHADSVKSNMINFYQAYNNLESLNSKSQLTKSNKDQFLKELNKLIDPQRINSYIKTKPTLNTSYDNLYYFAKNISLNIKNQNYFLAQTQINQIQNYCLACHSQLKEDDHFIDIQDKKMFKDLFKYADHLFLTRRFELAQNTYKNAIKKLIEENPNSILNNIEIINSLRKILSIEIRTYENLLPAIDFLEKYNSSNQKNFSPNINQVIKKWINELISLKDIVQKNKNKEIQNFIESVLIPELDKVDDAVNEMLVLYSTGKLTREILAEKNTSLHPKLLYFLAMAELHLEQNYFKSNSIQYLRICIENYPKNEFQISCFNELKNYFFQSNGVNNIQSLPVEVKLELSRLEKVMKAN